MYFLITKNQKVVKKVKHNSCASWNLNTSFFRKEIRYSFNKEIHALNLTTINLRKSRNQIPESSETYETCRILLILNISYFKGYYLLHQSRLFQNVPTLFNLLHWISSWVFSCHKTVEDTHSIGKITS